MIDQLALTHSQWQAMRRHVRRRAPQEACGLLAGKGRRVEQTIGIPNAEHSPQRYRMEPHAQLRAFRQIEAAGLELIGIYHSHPSGPEHPSPTDLSDAAYPVAYLIWFRVGKKWQARGFCIAGGKFSEIVLQIVNS